VSWLDLPRVDEPEDIDNPEQPFEEIARSMGDVACSNRLFGGTRAVIHHVSRLLKNVPKSGTIRILDIATGSADIPKALLAWGNQHGRDLYIVGLDNLPSMLHLAQQTAGGVHLVRGDALHLPFAPGAFDIALCALAFHHLGFENSAHVLAEMDRLTTRGFVVTDLRRDRPTYYGVKAALALIHAHPFTRHDGPASVLRAFTVPEYRKMVGLSGVHGVHIFTHWYYRVALVQDKPQTADCQGQRRSWTAD
jgi:hypothetical protein